MPAKLVLKSDPKTARERLKVIIRARSFGLGEVTLVSGRKSHFYFNLKPTMLDPEGAALIAQLVLDALAEEKIDYIGGLEMGAVPIAGAIAAFSALAGKPIPAFFVRKQPKEHGAKLAIEGLAPSETLHGKRVAVIEDVTTTGGSAMKALAAAKDAGAVIALILTIVDRQEGAAEAFATAGLPFRALFTADEFLRG